MNFLRKFLAFTLGTTCALTLHDYTLHKTPKPLPIPLPAPSPSSDTFHCTTAWLSRILGFPVNGFELTPSGGGLTTQTYLMKLNSADENCPRSMFIKYLIREKKETFQARILWVLLGSKENLGRKEAFFYHQLRTNFLNHGIKTAYPYYVGIEDYGDRSSLFTLLGFKTLFRGVFCLEDLGKYDNFPTTNKMPESCAFFIAKKLAQFHALNWKTPIHPDLPAYIPNSYIQYFNLSPNFYTKYPNSQNITNRIQLWEKFVPQLNEPHLRDSLYDFSGQYSKVSKYFHNDVASSGPLFKQKTFLHGDLQIGNLFFVTEPSPNNPLTKEVKDVIFCDWQSYGYGHPSTEFVYFLAHVAPDPARDLKLMRVYYEELTKTIPPEEYPWPVFLREVEIRTLGLGMSALNLLRESPGAYRKNRKGFSGTSNDMEEVVESFIPRLERFARVVQKWKNENTFDRIEDIKE